MNIDKDKEVEKAVNGFKDLMSAFGWNITQEKKTDNNKLDKDIEIVKKFIEETQEAYSETLVDGKVYRIENIPLEFKPTKELANSISRILSELEELRKYDIRKIEMKNGAIEKAPSFTKREIELMNLGIALYCNN